MWLPVLWPVEKPLLCHFELHHEEPQSTSHIPVIMLTSKDQETDRVWAERQGAKDYIIKPAEEKELMGKIDALLAS